MCSYAELGSNGKERIDATLRIDKTPHQSILLKSMIQNVNRRTNSGAKILTAANLVNWNIVTNDEQQTTALRQVPSSSILSKSIDINNGSANRLQRKNSVNRSLSKSIALVKTNDTNENVTLQMVPASSSPNSFKLPQRLRSGNNGNEDQIPLFADQRQLSQVKLSAKDKKLRYRDTSFSKDLNKMPRSHTNSELESFFSRGSAKAGVLDRNINNQARISRKPSGKDLLKLESSLSNLSNPGSKLFKRDNSSSQPSMVPFPSETSKLNARSVELSNLKQEQRKQIYALNALMTNLEHENFVEFCRDHDIDVKQY